jgi:hypothetical protein
MLDLENQNQDPTKQEAVYQPVYNTGDPQWRQGKGIGGYVWPTRTIGCLRSTWRAAASWTISSCIVQGQVHGRYLLDPSERR